MRALRDGTRISGADEGVGYRGTENGEEGMRYGPALVVGERKAEHDATLAGKPVVYEQQAGLLTRQQRALVIPIS